MGIGPLAAVLLDVRMRRARSKGHDGSKSKSEARSYSLPEYQAAAVNASTYVVPLVLCWKVVAKHGSPSLQQLALIPISIVWNVGVCMSLCLHRYFAHGAFTTSRPFQFVLGFVGCCAYQGSPLWWASKHRRHHAHCEDPDDPHAWSQTNLIYAWFGWTMHPKEMSVDKQYVSGLLRFPELRLLDTWFLAPCVLTGIVWYHAFGALWMVCGCIIPMYMSRVLTLFVSLRGHSYHHQH